MPENPRIEELRRRVEADPASIAFAALAEEYRRLGRFDEAIDTCVAGLQRHPAYLSARVTLGRALLENADYTSAREQFETVLRSAPENIAATRGLAQIHERLGHSTEMDPHLAQLMREHVDSLPPPAPAQPPEPEPLELQAPPEPNEPPPLDLPLAPLATVSPIEPDIPDLHEISEVSDAAGIAEAPDVPHPAMVAAAAGLERFLAAIQHARRA